MQIAYASTAGIVPVHEDPQLELPPPMFNLVLLLKTFQMEQFFPTSYLPSLSNPTGSESAKSTVIKEAKAH